MTTKRKAPAAKRKRRGPPKHDMKVVWVPAAKLKASADNARVHDEANLAAIRASIDRNGVYQPIIVQQKGSRIIAGHGRLEVMKERGIDPVPCLVLRVSDAKAREIALLDNRSAELADWDPEKLKAALDAIAADLSLTPLDVGFTDDDLAAIIGEPAAADDDDDEEPEEDHEPAAAQFKVIVNCKDEKDQEALVKSLRGRGFKCHKMTS